MFDCEREVKSCGVYAVPKDRNGIDALKKEAESKHKAVIVGAGFIGIEVAAELKERGKEVVVIGKQNRVLQNALDAEFSTEAEAIDKKETN